MSKSMVLKETEGPTYFTNDIRLASALVTVGLPIVQVKDRQNPNHKKPEILFGFEQTTKQRDCSMAFLSGNLMVDGKTILDNRESLLTYVINGSRELIEQINK